VELLVEADEVDSLPDLVGDPESDDGDDAAESPDVADDEDDVELDEPLRLSVR